MDHHTARALWCRPCGCIRRAMFRLCLMALRWETLAKYRLFDAEAVNR